MVGYLKNQCFLDHLPVLQWRNLIISIEKWKKDTTTMRSRCYPKEKAEEETQVQVDLFKLDIKRQISNAFGVLSSLHNLHFGWLFI